MTLETYLSIRAEMDIMTKKIVNYIKYLNNNRRTFQNYKKYDDVYSEYFLLVNQIAQLKTMCAGYEDRFCELMPLKIILKEIYKV